MPPDIRHSGKTEEFTRINVGLLKIVLVSCVLITSITLGMSISHIFGTSHSEVLKSAYFARRSHNVHIITSGQRSSNCWSAFLMLSLNIKNVVLD